MSRKEDIKNRFIKRIEEGSKITYAILKKEDPTLLYGIERLYGSVSKMCQEVGISQQEMIEKYGFTNNINKRTLSEEEMRERLLYLKSIGKLTTNAMRTEFEDLRLEQSLKKVYGSVNNGLDFFKLERDTRRTSREKIIESIKNYQSQGVDLCYSNMIIHDSALVSNANNLFKKGWNKTLTDLGIDFTAKRIPYSKESIKERLDEIFKEYQDLNYQLIKQVDGSILYYAGENYDTIEDFYTDMGYNPKEYLDYSTQKSRGRKFELVFKEILEALSINFKHNKHFSKEIRPDFQLDNNVWIDCKLSSWTSTTKKTVMKYNNHCEKLIIVYLRGNKRKLYEYKDYNVEFRKIDYYYKLLESIDRTDLILKCQAVLD